MVTGIGRIEGTPASSWRTTPRSRAAPTTPSPSRSTCGRRRLHRELPCVYLVDSGGAFLPLQADVFPDRDHFGRILQPGADVRGHPAGRARHGQLHRRRGLRAGYERRDGDRQGTGTIFLGGLLLVKAATARTCRPRTSAAWTSTRGCHGVADHEALDDEHALALGRSIVANLNRRPPPPPWDRADPEPPAVDPAGLYGAVSSILAGPSTSARSSPGLVDGSRFGESSSRAMARRSSAGSPTSRAIPSGSLPTTGSCSASQRSRAPTSSSSPRSAVSRCCSCRTSRVHDRPRVRGRRHREGRCEARDRGGFGRGPEVHRHHWRQLRCGQLRDGRPGLPAAVPVDVAERADQRHGRPAGGPRPVDGPWRLRQRRGTRRLRSPDPGDVRARGSPYFSTARLWDDGVIDPLDTRRVLAMGIEAALHAPIPDTRFGVFRM